MDASACSWSLPPAVLELRPDEVHVWRASLDGDGDWEEDLSRSLSPDERERAGRFSFSKDRTRFTTARGLLRVLLGKYLDVEPGGIVFRYGPTGKPSLAQAARFPDLRFNLSHSGGLALYAISLGREVGVDLERLRDDLGHREIAARFFAPGEGAQLFSLPEAQRVDGFFALWTLKEAYVKAVGAGLSRCLQEFEVSLHPGGRPSLGFASDAREVARWSLCELDPGSGFKGALAAEGQEWRLRCWELPPGRWENAFR